jgi:hypothetical protein
MEQGTAIAILKLLGELSPTFLFWLLALLVATPFGIVLLVLIFWFITERKQSEMLRIYREDVAKISRFYEDNVILVKSWEKVATGLLDQVILNTQSLQRMNDVCINNMFCPNARVPK